MSDDESSENHHAHYYDDDEDEEDLGLPPDLTLITGHLIDLQESKEDIPVNELNLRHIVDFWMTTPCRRYFISADVQCRLGVDCINLFNLQSKMYLEDITAMHEVKKFILSTFFLKQCKVTELNDIVQIVNKLSDDDNLETSSNNEKKLKEALPFCYQGCLATKSTDAMKQYIQNLDRKEQFIELARAEPFITITISNKCDGTNIKKKINSLVTLNYLVNSLTESVTSTCLLRITHNGRPIVLSSSGKKSLAKIGLKNNDVLQMEELESFSE